jgi:DNA-binding protein H-NS
MPVLSAAAIRAKIRLLQKQAQKVEQRSTKGLRAVAAAVGKHGLSLAQLREAFTLSKGGRKRSPVAGRKVPVKYRDSTGNAWTGRGRPPLWLVAAEKAGKKRETFLVTGKRPKTRLARSKRGAAAASKAA